MLRETTRSYAGRQLDIEMLKHVERMLPIQRVYPEVHTSPRIVSGIEKAVQRYAKTYLTHVGTVRLAGRVGSTILHDVWTGRVSNLGTLSYLHALANVSTLKALWEDDARPDIYGELPDDERIASTEVVNLELDYSTRTVKVHVRLVTAAGDTFTFIIPVGSGIK